MEYHPAEQERQSNSPHHAFHGINAGCMYKYWNLSTILSLLCNKIGRSRLTRRSNRNNVERQAAVYGHSIVPEE